MPGMNWWKFRARTMNMKAGGRMSEVDRRLARLAKQPEIEDDDDEVLPTDVPQGADKAATASKPLATGIPCPTVEPASSSSEASPDDTSPTNIATTRLTSPMTRKQTLTRTPALEGTSPPPDSLLGQYSGSRSSSQDELPLPNGTSGNHAQDKNVKKGASAYQAKEFLLASHDVSSDSGRGTMDNETADVPTFTGDAKLEANPNMGVYKDSTGVDLLAFFKTTFHKSMKDRKTLLSYEKELTTFITDSSAESHKMSEMNPYDRMVAHRIAAYLGLDHNVDQSGKCIIVSRTAHTRKPEIGLQKLIDPENQPTKRILLRKPSSLDEKQSWSSHRTPFGQIKAKSLEEREQKYSEARQRIFKADENTNFNSDGVSDSSHLLSTHPHHHPHIAQQRSLDSLRPNMHLLASSAAAKPYWSSTESSGYGTAGQEGHLRVGHQRAAITKSHSYGGPPAPSLASASVGLPLQHEHQIPTPSSSTTYAAADSISTNYESPASLPSNQDPATPTGSLSDQSPLSRSGSETGQSPMSQTHQYPPTQHFAYIVSPDLSSIPPGSLIIDPQTMEPHLNPDGTEYHFDPACPPPFALQPAPVPGQVQHTGPQAANIIYPNSQEQIADLTARFAGTSLTPVDGINPMTPEQMAAMGMAGQPLSFLPSYGQATPAVLSSSQPAQFSQPLYLTSSPSAGQPIKYIAYPLGHHSGQPLVPTASLDGGQSHAAIPMPSVGVPSFSAAGGYQVITPTTYPISPGAIAATPQCIDLGSGITYAAAAPTPESHIGGSAGRLVGQPLPTHNMVQTYSLAPYPSNQQHQQQQLPAPQQAAAAQQQQQPNPTSHLPQHQPAAQHPPQPHPHFQYSHNPSSSSFVPSVAGPSSVAAASFYTGFPLASPKPPSPSNQQPAAQSSSSSSATSQQQPPQHPQQAVFYPFTIPVMPAAPASSGANPVKPNANPTPGVMANTFRSATPPNHHHHHNNNHQQQQQHQPPTQSQPPHQPHPGLAQQPPAPQGVTPANGVQHHHHHPAQMTVNFGQQPQQQPMTFAPNQAMAAQQGSTTPFVALPGGGYHHLRPMGAIFPGQAMPTQPGAATSYQILRSGRAVPGEVRMMTPGGLKPRIPSLQLSGSYGQQIRYKGSNQSRSYGKGGKRTGGRDSNAEASCRDASQPRNTPPSTQPTVAPSPLIPSTPASRQ